MNKFKTIFASLLALGLTVSLGQAVAHHSIQAEYGGGVDPTKTIEGKVTEVRWSNPHIEIYVDVTGGDLTNGEWIVNSHAPGLMARTYDIRADQVNAGDDVRIIGWESRQGVPRFHMRAIAVNDGPMRSTHRSSDVAGLRDGTQGEIVPAPGVGADSRDTYGANLGGTAKDDLNATDAAAETTGEGQNWLLILGGLVIVLFGGLIVWRKVKAK
jgi:LPXTG-motif cell wall-anchored protein